ncbi:MAG: flagellar motor protein MotB [Deltaproteobacteria bacterium]|nr:flagellar motor protein MotB [Deltaproteobacteria bacterium]
MAKRQHHEEHENHERWLVSYADFITLLFAFFVVLYSTSKVDQKKLVQVTESIKFAMHFKGTGGIEFRNRFEGPPTEGGRCKSSPMGTEQRPRTRKQDQAEQVRKKIERRLRKFLQTRPETHVSVEANEDRLSVRLSASHFFDQNQAAIRPEMIPVLDVIGAEMGALGMPIRIEGHTDETAVATMRYRDNWDLSASRAASVASFLQHAHNMDGKMLSAAGFGSTRPLSSSNTTAGREANRRVELAIEFQTPE